MRKADLTRADLTRADLTVTQAAAELSVVAETVRRLLLAGHLTGYKAGRRWRVTRAALDQFKASGGVRPVGRPKVGAKKGKADR